MEPAAASPSAYPANALPPGTRLGEFEVLDVLGIGGFGIVYRALDHALEREVAIKEYMPAALAGRTETMHVSVRSQSDAETFALGLRSFVNEARLLARFDHPSLVKVYRFWEAHDTAYMAMPIYRGRTLKAVRAGMDHAPDEPWLRALLTPMLGALEALHAQGVYHRDIAPDNILIEPDGRPVLLDFGAARRVIGDRSQTLTAILKPAYAPIEQYAEASAARQGPWTDLYALGATLYHALTGRAPMPATARALQDELPPLAPMAVPGCTPRFLRAIDWMLAPRPADRPQSVAALRALLAGEAEPPVSPPAAPPPAPSAPPVAWERTAVHAPAGGESTLIDIGLADPAPRGPAPVPAPSPSPSPSPSRGLLIGGAVVVVAVLGLWALWPSPPQASTQASTQAPTQVPTPEPAATAAPATPGPLPMITEAAPETAPASASAAGPAPATPAAVTAPRPRAAAVPASAQAPALVPKTDTAVARPEPSTALPDAPPPAAASVAVPRPASPAPVTAPAPAAALSDDPGALCGRRVLMAQVLCMERECLKTENRSHPACLRWRSENANRAQQP